MVASIANPTASTTIVRTVNTVAMPRPRLRESGTITARRTSECSQPEREPSVDGKGEFREPLVHPD